MTSHHNTTNPGLWIDESNDEAWQQACRRDITAWLAPLAGKAPSKEGSLGDLTVSITPPDANAAEAAVRGNYSLTGRIDVQWGEAGLQLELPMPFNGAFLFHRPESGRALVSVWTSWLAEAPGIRLVRPTSLARRKKLEWRVGLPGGRNLAVALNSRYGKKIRKSLEHHDYFGDPAVYPDWLREHLAVIGLREAKGERAAMPGLWKQIIAEHAGDLGEPTDADDLEHRILVTFPVWLRHHLAKALLRTAQNVKRRGLGKQALSILTGKAEGDEKFARSLWAEVCGRPAPIAFGITSAIHGNQRFDPTDPVHPTNPLDLAARITRVKRINAKSSQLAEMPAEFRQNHPSFQGRLCPVDSPESEQVGLTMHLAAGARIDVDGRILPASDPVLQLGLGAGLIPFFQHNDGARNMMGAKNLRQAVPTFGRARAMVETGGESMLQKFTAPLVQIGACPGAESPDSEDSQGFALGRDLLAAYLPWEGWNFEDAVVVGEQVVQEHSLDLSFKRTVRRKIPAGWAPCDEEENGASRWSRDGLAMVNGDLLTLGSPIARFIHEGSEAEKPLEIRYDDRTPAILKSIRFLRRHPWMSGVLEYELEVPIALKPGDKLMGRHGNKGVVGAIVPTNEMPRLPDCETLPENLRGRTVDVLLNPHGVISRMNLGQLLETHLGWLLHAGQHQIEDLVGEKGDATFPARAFANRLDHEKVRTALESTGLDRHGRVRLKLPGGGETASPVVVGFQHIVRLRHIPEMKSQARRGGLEASYSVRTGQAVHGRRHGGGQRLGEMEEWSLAGHRADRVIAEMLGLKSTAELAGAWKPGTEEASSPCDTNGFSPLLKDWLFALRLSFEDLGDGHHRLSHVEDKKVIQYSGPWSKVVSEKGMTAAPAAEVRCLQGGTRTPCGHRLLGGEKIAFPSTAKGKEGQSRGLKFRDLLAHLFLRAAGPIRPVEGTPREYDLPLIDLRTGKPTHPLRLVFSFTPGSDQLMATLAAADEGQQPSGWPENLKRVALYGRFGRNKQEQQKAKDGKKNKTAEELLTEFERNEAHALAAGDMRLSCPDHSSKPLVAVPPFALKRQGVPGGLFDPAIFGEGLPQPGEVTLSRWGFIQIPVSVPYPVEIFRGGIVEDSAPPEIDLIPVLPARYRWGILQGDTLVESDFDRKGYAPLIRLCRAYEEADDKNRPDLEARIAKQVGRLFALLLDALRGKTGLIRRHGLGRRVDRTARLVATPNPELDWDQVGVPSAVLLELMGDMVAAWKRADPVEPIGLVASQLESLSGDDLKSAVNGLLDAWKEGHAAEKEELVLNLLTRPTWREAVRNPRLLDTAAGLLKEYLKAHPDYVVLLNRQPSLHRDSFVALHPVPLPPEGGDVVQLCPLVCKGLAADFDGDEVVLHVPLSPSAQDDARKLLPSRNLFSLANQAPGNVLAHFDQDFVLGTWWMGALESSTLRDELSQLLPEKTRDWFSKQCPTGPITKEMGSRLLHRLAREHREEAPTIIAAWMRLAFRACTQLGVSYGYYELLDLADRISPKITSSGDNDSLDLLAREELEKVLSHKNELDYPALHLAAMALSGARGKKQVRQLVAARGHLDPGATGFARETQGDKFRIASSLAAGMDSSESFWAAMNARSSMCDKKLGTGHAGGLTRHLVFALRAETIVSKDCGNGLTDEHRSLVSCGETRGFCARCYGHLPDGKLPPIGFPAGLVAAQSIGERGTQLSMQSFHAGERQIDIDVVRRTLGLGGNKYADNFEFLDPSEADRFAAFFQESNAYHDLEVRHFHLLWTALHREAVQKLHGHWEKSSATEADLATLKTWWQEHSQAGQKLKEFESPKNLSLASLRSVAESRDPVERIGYRDPDAILFFAVTNGIDFGKNSPLAHMLL